MPRGGKRKGAGMPPGTIKKNAKNWPQFSTRISHEMLERLRQQQNQSKTVDQALREYFDRCFM